MNERLIGGLMLALAAVLYGAAAASLVAMFHALTVRTTLAAVESAFGTLVVSVLLLALARKCWDAGKKRRTIKT